MKKDYIDGNTTKYINQQKRNRDFAAFMLVACPVLVLLAVITAWVGA